MVTSFASGAAGAAASRPRALDMMVAFRPLVFAVALPLLVPAAAASGTTSALLAQARALEHGEGVARDQARAAALYCDAAREGDAEGAFALGWMYANGRGLPRDEPRAVAMFQWAARDGHEHARVMLSYLRGTQPEPPDCLRPRVDPLAWGPPAPLPEIVAGPLVDEPDPFADLPRWKQVVADLVHKTAPRYGVDPRLALAVISVESNFNARARSHKDAMGLMQLIPETAERFNVKDAFDPRQNIQGGLAYLRFLLAYYEGQVTLAAAAYNAGERAVDRHRGIPPYPETQDYVKKVLALYRRDLHPFDARLARPSPILAGPLTGAAVR
jgi:TPR repeat protein